MKKILAVFVIFLSVNSGFAQPEFKEVKTAQDVIDNNINATGGAEKIESVKSETITGDMIIQGMEISYIVFRSDTLNFKKAEGEAHGQNMVLLRSLTADTYAWEYQMNSFREFEGEELLNRKQDLIVGNINFVLNFNKKGYTAYLEGTDSLDGKLCYKIIFSKDGEVVRTDLYDSKTFFLSEIIKPNGSKLDYYEYRETDGLYRPFKIDQLAQSDLTIIIKQYEFNKAIDQDLLLKKPSGDTK